MAESPIIIGTRGSALALAQANLIIAQCRAAFPSLAFELKIIKTTGDRMLDIPLQNQLDKGFFTKELEVALLADRVDAAVHSLKDLPTQLPDGLAHALGHVILEVTDNGTPSLTSYRRVIVKN